MPRADDRPALHAVEGGVLSLSGPALQEFLRAVLARGVPFRFRAGGTSMDPFIRDGDIVTIVPADARGPRIGDVVACCHPREGHLVIHRIVASMPGGMLIRGDANEAADGVVAVGQVLGVVSAIGRDGRRVMLGNGPERWILAHLSRAGLLRRIVALVRAATRRMHAALGRGGEVGGA